MSPYLQHFARFLRQQPRRPLLLLLGAMILAGLSEGAGLSLLLPMLQHVQAGAAPVAGWGSQLSLPVVLLLFLLLQACRIGLQYQVERWSQQLQYEVVDDTRTRCFDAVLQSRWNWLAQRDNAELANLLLTDINRLGQCLYFFLQMGSSACLLLAYGAVALVLAADLTLCVLVLGGLLLLLQRRLRRAALQLGVRMGGTSQLLHRAVQESVTGMKMAKILGNERRHLQVFQQSLDEFRQLQTRYLHGTAVSKARSQLLSVACLLLLLYVGVQYWQLSLAQMGSLVFIFARLMPLAMQLQNLTQQWLFALPALAHAHTLLATCQQQQEPAAALPPLPPLSLQHSLQLQDVSYCFPGRHQPALSGVSLTLSARTTTAVVGGSGAGKSTLADVLMGLLYPDQGSLWLDGQPLSGSALLQWRRAVAYVPQETFLFSDSIRHNLLWAAPQASEAQLWAALDKAAANFVRQLPDGLDTVVGDQGMRLSGGERQRIALARALLGEPALLILDEATSALDGDNEQHIRRAIENLHGRLTVLVISHRPATVQHADRVIVMQAGQVQAQGSWAEVAAQTRFMPGV